MKKENLKGSIFRKRTGIETNGKFAYNGSYFDAICLEQTSTALVYEILNNFCPEKNKFDGKTSIGAVSSSTYPSESITILASSIEEYSKLPSTKLPVKEVEVIKEIEVEIEVAIDCFNETLVDKLYNWYCKKKKRNQKFV